MAAPRTPDLATRCRTGRLRVVIAALILAVVADHPLEHCRVCVNDTLGDRNGLTKLASVKSDPQREGAAGRVEGAAVAGRAGPAEGVPTFATDTSYYQAPVDDTYPHPWVIFRGCDGTFVDPLFSKNYAWACKAAAAGKIVGFTVYAVYRPGIDIVQQIKGIVGVPDKHLTVMIDVETWGGQIGGNRSSEITRMAEGFASWLGSRKRVLAYANRGDFAVLFPSRPSWLKLVVAGYSSVQPVFPNMIGWQYSDGEARWSVPAGYPRSTPPFGACDHNVFPFHTPQQLAVALGVAEARMTPKPATRRPWRVTTTWPASSAAPRPTASTSWCRRTARRRSTAAWRTSASSPPCTASLRR
jgi:hypothetical protein